TQSAMPDPPRALRLDPNRPAVRVWRGAVLDPHDRVVEALRGLADPAAVDLDRVVLVRERAHRRDDGRGPRPPDLLERAVGGRRHDLVDRDLPLVDLHAPLPEQGESGVAGHARE